jgi:hypothetical protein
VLVVIDEEEAKVAGRSAAVQWNILRSAFRIEFTLKTNKQNKTRDNKWRWGNYSESYKKAESVPAHAMADSLHIPH